MADPSLTISGHDFWFVKRAVKNEIYRLKRVVENPSFEPKPGARNVDAMRLKTGEELLAKMTASEKCLATT
jgi:hypothetical protein